MFWKSTDWPNYHFFAILLPLMLRSKNIYRHVQKSLWPIAIVAVFGCLFVAPQNASAGTLAENIVTKTNLLRQQQGLPKLKVDPILEKAASAHVQDMLRRQYFSHSSPGGQPFSSWLGSDRGKYSSLGENIAWNRRATSDKIVNGWAASPGHRTNMLSSTFTRVGVGVVRGQYQGKYTTMIVQLFGRPADSTQLLRFRRL